MSPEAITNRLRLASQLAALCIALGKAQPPAPTKRDGKHRQAK